jgi:hypothetical protein
VKEKLKRFYFCQAKNEDGSIDNIIIDSVTLNVGRVIFYPDYRTMVHKVTTSNHLAYSIVIGYNIALYYDSNLASGSRINAKPTILEELAGNLNQMAKFFYTFRIAERLNVYRKYETSRNP